MSNTKRILELSQESDRIYLGLRELIYDTKPFLQARGPGDTAVAAVRVLQGELSDRLLDLTRTLENWSLDTKGVDSGENT